MIKFFLSLAQCMQLRMESNRKGDLVQGRTLFLNKIDVCGKFFP